MLERLRVKERERADTELHGSTQQTTSTVKIPDDYMFTVMLNLLQWEPIKVYILEKPSLIRIRFTSFTSNIGPILGLSLIAQYISNIPP